MAENSKHKQLLITLLLTLLLVSSAYAALVPKVHAAEATVQEKGLSILNNVLSLDMAKYSVTAKENATDQASYLGVLPQEDVEYNLMSSENKLRALCTFVDGKLLIMHILENSGPPNMINAAASTNAVDMAKAFLNNYQAYTANSLYGKLKAALEGVEDGKNATKTLENARLEVTAIDGSTKFKWTYMFNGAIAPSKVVALSFKNGFLKYFVDTWNLHSIGTTNISLSKDEAVAIALETAKAHSWSLKLDAEALEAKNFNESNVRWTALLFDDSLGAGKPRSEDALILYPVWRVGIALDKWYGQLYGIEVDVWADSGEVRRVQEAWSTLPPPEGIPTANVSSEVLVSEAEPSLAMLIAFPTVITVALGAALVWMGRKRNAHVHTLLKPRFLKTGGILLCVLISSTALLAAIATVNATTRAGIIWGSESTGAGAYPNSWRKHRDEIDLQRQAAVAIADCFANHGYTGVNHQGIRNPGSSKSQILSDISYYQSNYNYVAVVDFDHGVKGYPSSLIAPPGEAHYMFEDNIGTWHDGAWHQEDGVYDMEIYPRIQPGNKIIFALINTCMSADTTGQGLLPPQPPSYNARALTMPFAWTGRLVMDKSTPGFNIAQHMSDDGYGDPDCGPQVYIGFPSGSASLMQRIPYDYGVHNYCYWVVWFFTYALSQELSVNQALDQASLLTWPGENFGDSPLRNGFTAYWWGLDPMPSSTMAVYGNGNIFLRYYEPDFVSAPSVSGPTSGYMGTAYEFSASSMDPYGHRVRYTFDWGDGSPQTVTDWYASGAVAHASHSWNSEGVFNVKVKAQCENGAWSSWSSPHTIEIGDFPTVTINAFSFQYGELYGVPVWIDGGYVGTTPYYGYVSPGSHQIQVLSDLYFTVFQYYYYDGIYNHNNPMTLSITSDKTITAYYY